uniref:Oxidation resistance protein 1 n=1 Tax=Macrostomum lignano TaxID=282301 RepID=A0A1I8HE73_9PLAT
MNFRKLRKTSLAKTTPTVQYLVQPGDTLCSLAVRFNTSTGCLRSLNYRVGSELPLLPGTVLNVPAPAAEPLPAQNGSPNGLQRENSQPDHPNVQSDEQNTSQQAAELFNLPLAELQCPRLRHSPESLTEQYWSIISQPDSLDDDWTFLDPDAEQRIQPGRSSLPLPRLLVPKYAPSEDPTPEACLPDELLLTSSRLRSLVEVLPPRAEGLDLCLLFSTRRHGHSLRSLYELSHSVQLDPATCCLLLASVANSDTLLGAFLPCPLRLPSNGCYGTGETMLLRWFDNDFKVYQATNTDGLFLRSSRHSLS